MAALLVVRIIEAKSWRVEKGLLSGDYGSRTLGSKMHSFCFAMISLLASALSVPLYKQAAAPIPGRVVDLLARMTPEEKVDFGSVWLLS